MTRGVHSPYEHYYRRVFIDAARAIETARSLDVVDASRVAVMGDSQGGGLTLAAAGLVPDVFAAMPDVPFLCHIARGVEIADTEPYSEVRRYLAIHRGAREQTLATLSYFDCVHFARRAHASALFSVGLMDLTCPPSTVYAAYNAYSGPKELTVYPDNDHEGGGPVHQREQLRWLAELLRVQTP
jgi:cephalosporin-C deacetylase